MPHKLGAGTTPTKLGPAVAKGSAKPTVYRGPQ
jgi:hypothetical protein